MVRHIVAWSFKEDIGADDRRQYAQKVKEELEALTGCIDGIARLKVCINLLPSGNRDMVLDSLFHTEEDLSAYQIHPEHQRVATFVRSITKHRVCLDYHE